MLGDEKALDWFRDEIKMEYACEFKARLGPDGSDSKTVRLLNRIVEWNNEGITIEGDQRHAAMGWGQKKDDRGRKKEENIVKFFFSLSLFIFFFQFFFIPPQSNSLL